MPRSFCCLFVLVFTLLRLQPAAAQTGFPTGLNGTVINLPCGNTCTPLTVKVPHLKATNDYILAATAYDPLVYTSPAGNELTALYIDDRFSGLINLPFNFCYYDSVYNTAVVGSNGLVTFDGNQANTINAYKVDFPLPYAGGIPNNLASNYYPPASLLIAFTDLNPASGASPPDRKIEWRIEGTAPYRKFIVSFFNVGTFGANTCGQRTPTTMQIVCHESSGLIDYYIDTKICQTSSSNGRSIMGIQNWQRNKAVTGAGRNATVWTAANEGWRFIPSGSITRFKRAELTTLSGTLLQTITTDTSTSTTGYLDLNFPSVCVPGASQQFVVKSYFNSCNSGAEIFSSDTITIVRGNVTATAATTAANCGPTGTATITLPAGAAPYTYTLNGGMPVTTNNNSYTYTGLASGTYNLAGTNVGGCTGSIAATVAAGSGLSAATSTTPTTCNGADNGGVTVQAQNGLQPYEYSLNGGAYQTSNTFTNLAAGTYTLSVRDAAGCIKNNVAAVVAAGASITATVSTTAATCNGSATGQAVVTPSANATNPVQYSLNNTNFQSSSTFSNLAAGTYTVYFKDVTNCSGTQTFTISQPSSLALSATVVGVKCFGQANGTATLTATGGTTPYQYSIDGTTYQTGNGFSLAAGTYTLYVKDVAGCIKTTDITITQPAPLTATAETTAASCNGGNDGTITVTAAGGQSNYQYSINGTSFQPANIFNAAEGTYTVVVKDANGCTVTTPAVVSLVNNLQLTVMDDSIVCEGSSAALHVQSNATQYAWTPTTTLSSANIANPIATPLVPTYYKVTATLGACTRTDSVLVDVHTAPLANAGSNNEICFGQSYTLQGSGGVEYLWSPTTFFTGSSLADTQNPTITPAQTTTYNLKVRDAFGCSSILPASVTITVTPPIVVRVLPRDTVVAKGDVVVLRASSAATNYSWLPATGLDNPSSQNPIATIERDVTYVVTGFTGAGCKGTDTVRIKVYNGPEIYVPSGFTPNGDGKNDVLRPFPVGIKELHYFRVFNRWGQLVYQTSSLNGGWDGRVSGVLQPLATYVWILEAVTRDNKVVNKRGTTTLLR